MGLFERRRSGIGTALLAGMGGMIVGAGIVAALTPMKGTDLRKLVLSLLDTKGNNKAGEEPLDQQIERMEGEGGVSHDVKPPHAPKGFESHS